MSRSLLSGLSGPTNPAGKMPSFVRSGGVSPDASPFRFRASVAWRPVRRTVLVQEMPLAVVLLEVDGITGAAIADFKTEDVRAGSVKPLRGQSGGVDSRRRCHRRRSWRRGVGPPVVLRFTFKVMGFG